MNTILCPNCHQRINIDEALAHQIEDGLKTQFAQEKVAFEKKVKLELWQKAQSEAQKQAVESGAKVTAELEAKIRAQEKIAKEQEELIKEQEQRAKIAEAAELEMRKRQRQLEEKEKQLQIQVERELDERLKIEQEKLRKLEEERSKVETDRFNLKEKEYQKQIDDMKALVEEARRKGSTGSQQLQGEVLELELEELLRQNFPGDQIEEVKKGQFGADVLQTVKDGFGKKVGLIVWESKQTERFSDKWLAKLREDCRTCHGSMAVLVTRSLPEDINVCGERERVWITGIDFVLPLAQLLRQTLIQVQQEKSAQSGKDVKTEMLYQYINSQEFRGRVEGIVESFREMKDDLDKEQRALQNIWKKREKQILRLATNTAYMYGEMQGLVGASLPSIQGLELEATNSHGSNKETKEIESDAVGSLFDSEGE